MATNSNKPPDVSIDVSLDVPIDMSVDVYGATLTRRQFVKTGGMLAVGFGMVGTRPLRGDAPKAAVAKNSIDPALLSSWLEIHPDNTVLIRTGKTTLARVRFIRRIGKLWQKS